MAEKKYIIDNAELMAEWDWEKNDELGFDPKTLTIGSSKKVWWKCQNGHEWQATIGSRNESMKLSRTRRTNLYNRKSGCHCQLRQMATAFII